MATTNDPPTAGASRTGSANHERLRRAWSEEQAAARIARAEGDPSAEWNHLERAHILSQPMAGPHVRTHVSMLGYAVRHRDLHETVGQLIRLVVAAPGTWTGKYPVGNTGGADVSAMLPMAIPDDLRPLLEDTNSEVEVA